MEINAILPFISSIIMIFFVYFVFNRFFKGGRKSYHLFLWGVGLTFYLVGSTSETIHSFFGWNPLVFRIWYLFGAILVAAWLGQGTVQLLMRRKLFSRVKLSLVILVVLTIFSVYGTVKIFTAQLEPAMLAEEINGVSTEAGFTETQIVELAAGVLRGTTLDDEGEVSDRKLSPLADAVITEAEINSLNIPDVGEVSVDRGVMVADIDGQSVTLTPDGESLQVFVEGKLAGTLALTIGREMHGHAIVTGGTRILTPFFNIYGLITLVGGAIYSSFLFLRKRIMPNRVIGNVLIAAGALMPGIGGLLSRFGMGGYLYVGELVGAIFMFAGFIAATSKPKEETVAEPVVAPASGR